MNDTEGLKIEQFDQDTECHICGSVSKENKSIHLPHLCQHFLGVCNTCLPKLVKALAPRPTADTEGVLKEFEKECYVENCQGVAHLSESKVKSFLTEKLERYEERLQTQRGIIQNYINQERNLQALGDRGELDKDKIEQVIQPILNNVLSGAKHNQETLLRKYTADRIARALSQAHKEGKLGGKGEIKLPKKIPYKCDKCNDSGMIGKTLCNICQGKSIDARHSANEMLDLCQKAIDDMRGG